MKMLAVLLSGLFLSACGVVSDKDLEGLGLKKSGKASSSAPEPVGVSLHLQDGTDSSSLGLGLGFYLVSSSAVNFSVSGCSSGYSVSNQSAAATNIVVKLYNHDQNCKAELNSFVYSGKTYVPVDGTALKGDAGTAELYKNQADATDTLMVRVHTQLPSPLTDGSQAMFIFQQIVSGANHTIANYSASETLEVSGIESPNLNIDDVLLTAVSSPAGQATFDVTFLCNAAMSEPGGGGTGWVCPSAGGDNQKIGDMKAKLITDTYAGALTYAQATTEMAAGTTAVTSGMKIAGDKFKIALTAPDQLYTHKNMLLIVSYTEPTGKGVSFKYYNVDIGDPQ